MHINIHIQRPWALLTVLAVATTWTTGIVGWGSAWHPHDDAGGEHAGVHIAQAMEDIDTQRILRELLARREEILRYQLHVLEDEAQRIQDPAAQEELTVQRAVLIKLAEQRLAAEKLLTRSLLELWESQGTMATNTPTPGHIDLSWPVEPVYGVSAGFDDEAYEKRFRIKHNAIDIPVEQGSVITAPADGVVTRVSMSGLSYSFVEIKHVNGFVTTYGHVIDSMVKEGDSVVVGMPIAHSGGRPGSPGAGLLTTGPHLHFAVRKDGALVDPLQYLSKR